MGREGTLIGGCADSESASKISINFNSSDGGHFRKFQSSSVV